MRTLRRQAVDGTSVAPAFQLGRADERRLVAAARKGDRKALARLLELLSGPIYRFGRGFCGDSPDAEDVAQIVLAAVARRLDDFRGEASLTTWAYVVARNACTRERRKTIRAKAKFESLDASTDDHPAFQIADPREDPARAAERRELGDLLGRAIATLPDAQRQVLMLRDVEGLPAAEVGRLLGLSERAIKSRLHRARVALRETLSPMMGDGEVAAPKRTGRAKPKRREADADVARCPDTVRLISRYVEGELDQSVCANLEAHVLQCADCGEACDTLRGALASCRSWRSEALPREVKEAVRGALKQFMAQR